MQRSNVRRGAMWVMTGLAVAILGCSDDGTGPVTTGDVSVVDDAFQPSSIQVAAGATVTFTWTGSNLHNVTFAAAAIPDASNRTTGTHTVTMPTTAGTYDYQCTNHTGMTGSITVS